jgi:hypothetical protein
MSLIDPSVATGIGLAVLGSKDLLNRLLGPSADYLGEKTRGVIEKCDVNLDWIFRIATRKLGDRIQENGSVSPRVLKHVVDEARFCEDEIVAEYLGGVLASSRANGESDDRGVCFLNDIKSLSSYQLRTHFLIYSTLPRFADAIRFNPHSYYGEHGQLTLIFTDDSYLAALNCADGPLRKSVGRHSFLGLEARLLCNGGAIAFQNHENGDPPRAPWRFCWPTQYGHELFVWGLGLGDQVSQSYFDVMAGTTADLLPQLEVVEIDSGKKWVTGVERQY